jgi:hypothetical protein
MGFGFRAFLAGAGAGGVGVTTLGWFRNLLRVFLTRGLGIVIFLLLLRLTIKVNYF